MSYECWIPDLEYYENYKSWEAYENSIYAIFKKDFIDTYPTFRENRVTIRKYPLEYGKEDSFFHVTCQDYSKNGNRSPDFRRCERIRWIRAFIENYNCDSSLCESCEGIKLWEEPYRNKKRIHILLEEERYIVVLESRKSYYQLVTAFYFEHDHTLKKKLKHYEQYKNM